MFGGLVGTAQQVTGESRRADAGDGPVEAGCARDTRTTSQAGQQFEAKRQSIVDAMEVQPWNSGQQTETKMQALVDTLEAWFVTESQRAEAKFQALAIALVDGVDAPRRTLAGRGEAATLLGYPVAQCPAPAGWDQSINESALIRTG